MREGVQQRAKCNPGSLLGDFETRPENEEAAVERERDWSVKDLGSRIRCIEPRPSAPSAPPLTVRSNEQDTLLLCKWLKRRRRRRHGGRGRGRLHWPRLSSRTRRLSDLKYLWVDETVRCFVARKCGRSLEGGGSGEWRGAKPLIRQMGESRFSD